MIDLFPFDEDATPLPDIRSSRRASELNCSCLVCCPDADADDGRNDDEEEEDETATTGCCFTLCE